VIFTFVLISPLSLFSQFNRVENIIARIEENDFKKAKELKSKLKDDTPLILQAYIQYLILNDLESPERNIDSAYFSLLSVLEYYSTSNDIDKDEYCLRFKLCGQDLIDDKLHLEQEAFVFYSKNLSIDDLRYFAKNFHNDELISVAYSTIEKVEFDLVESENSTKAFSDFLTKYPNSKYKEIVLDKWSEIEYQQCLLKNEEKTYRDFLKNFPNSKKIIEAKTNLGKIAFKKDLIENNIIGYTEFLNEFDNEELKFYLRNEIDTIRYKICFANYQNLKNSDSLESLYEFTTKFIDCEFADSIMNRIEILEWNNLKINFSKEKANSFLNKFPDTEFKYEILTRLFDVEYLEYSLSDDNVKIYEFRKKYKGLNDPRISMIVKPQIFENKRDGQSKFGFIDPFDNNIIIYPLWDQVREFSNGLAAVKLQNEWGFIDKNGLVVIPIMYEDVKDFKDGLAGVKYDGLWTIIDKNMMPITEQLFQNVGDYNSGLINVNTLTNGWVFISNEGKLKSTVQSYLAASPFNSGFAFVQDVNGYFIIDTNFNTVFKVDYELPLYNNTTIYEGCSWFEPCLAREILCNYYNRRTPYSLKKYGNALLLNEGLVYDLNKKECWISKYVYFDNEILAFGNRITDRNPQAKLFIYSERYDVQEINLIQSSTGNTDYISISKKQDHLILLHREKNKSSMVKINAVQPIIPCKFKIVQNGNGFYFEDLNKNILGNKMDYTFASEFKNGRAIVGISDKFLVIDTNGNQVGGIYNFISRLNDDLFVVCNGGVCYLMDYLGNYLSKGYNHIDSKIYNGTIMIVENNLKGFIDTTGDVLIEPQFLDAIGFSNGVAIVTAKFESSKCKNYNFNCWDCNYWECRRTRYVNKLGVTVAGDFQKKLEYFPVGSPDEYMLLNEDSYFLGN
jgi:hypothetical protein